MATQQEDYRYAVVNEDGAWKSIFDGKLLVTASNKDACVKETEHYLAMMNKIMDDKFNYDTSGK